MRFSVLNLLISEVYSLLALGARKRAASEGSPFFSPVCGVAYVLRWTALSPPLSGESFPDASVPAARRVGV